MDNVVIQTVSLAVNASEPVWKDSGLVVARGDGLHVVVSGRVEYGDDDGEKAFPEGTYDDDNDSGHELDLPNLRTYADFGLTSGQFLTATPYPMALAMCLWPDGSTPPSTAGGVDPIAPNRDYLASPLPDSYFSDAGSDNLRVWLAFNDKFTVYSNNGGSFSVTLERLSTSDIPLPETRGGRTMSPAYFALTQAQSQAPAWCWVITPLSGEREFYTSLDIALALDGFTSANGENEIPVATYLPGRGVDVSSLPTTLKVEADGVDVTVLNFDRLRLLGNYYFGAIVEVFEVDWQNLDAGRWVAFAGTMGNAQVGDLSAIIELVSFDDSLSKTGDDVILYSCSHTFCEGICQNQTLHDGLTLSDWTRAGAVVASLALTKIRVSVSAGFLTDGERETEFYSPSERLAAWQARLGEGRLRITQEGENLNMIRQIKRVTQVSTDVLDIELRQRFVVPPGAGVTCEISSGCVKSPEMCQLYRNYDNYGGFPFLVLQDGLRRK